MIINKKQAKAFGWEQTIDVKRTMCANYICDTENKWSTRKYLGLYFLAGWVASALITIISINIF